MPSKKNTIKKSPGKAAKTKPASGNFNVKAISYTILAAAAIALIFYCKSFDFIQDDSFITFRYVKNFTEGNGLVFNIGDKVEGYTCFLWIILLSVVKLIGINFISASQTIGIIFSLITLYFTFRISIQIFPKDYSKISNIIFSMVAVIMVLSNGAFSYWTVSGMETAMFSCLTTIGIYFYLKELSEPVNSFPYSSLILLSASLARPEGVLIFAVTLLHKIIITAKKAPYKSIDSNKSFIENIKGKRNIIWVLLYLIPGLIFMIWRYSYYGYLLPNTFYAKTGTTLEYFKTGVDYFNEFAATYGLYGILIILIFFNLRKSEKFYEYLYLVSIFVIYSLYIIYVGGDVLRPSRFFVPILPVFYVLVQEGAYNILTFDKKKQPAEATAYLTIIALLVIAFISYKNPFEQIKKDSELENGLVEKMRLSASWLKSKQIAANRNLVVAATTIGAISYYSDVTLIDMLGLTDKVIAHNPHLIPEISSNAGIGWKEKHYNAEYVLSRKPDYIYFSTGLKPSAYAERGLFTIDEFLKYYYPYYFSLKEYQFTECIYKRKSDEEVKNEKTFPPNPNYQKSFVNLFNQAMNTRDKSKVQEAIDLYKQAIQIGPPDFAAPYQLMGDLYLQNRNKEKAVENYKKAIEIDDYNIMSHYSLYQIYLQEKDTASAQEQIEKILKYSPDLLK